MNPTETSSIDTTRSSEESRPTKDSRLNLRVSRRQDALIRRAAAAMDKSVSDFILDTVAPEAERVLTDRRWFVVDDASYDQFVELLDAPMPDADERLRRLANPPQRPSFLDS